MVPFTSFRLTRSTRRQGGQTIVIALVVLLLLLILGIVFAGILNRSIQGAATQGRRLQANDLGEMGIKYALDQLVDSEEGADWRGAPVSLGAGTTTTDPDAYYLRPGNPGVNFPGKSYEDQGGPDGLGFFTRVSLRGGRALVRVSYRQLAENEVFGQAQAPGSYVQSAGRSYLYIESIGRNGVVDPRDPTTLTRTPIQYRGFASTNDLQTALRQFQEANNQIVNARSVVAYAQIGITDNARFITNIHRETRPADIGVPKDLGVTWLGTDVGPVVPAIVGKPAEAFGNGGTQTRAFGSLHSNADLRFFGDNQFYMNPSLGDGITVAGSVQRGEDTAQVRIAASRIRRTGPTSAPAVDNDPIVGLSGPALDSTSDAFSTMSGLLRDGQEGTDAAGFARGVGYREPPRIAIPGDRDRYRRIARDSGRGVYVDNADDRQMARTEGGRIVSGDSESLVYDWLNPNNQTFARTGWRGPVYLPRGAELLLDAEGFSITRDPLSKQPFWPNGARKLRFRLGRGTDGRTHVVNETTPGIADISGTLTAANFQAGPLFDGVIYFEGNARVRGVIPTDVQLSVVSGATLYIEGSILKGVTGNSLTATAPVAPVLAGQRLSRPSASMIGLFARDYVCVNPTLFVGPTSSQNIEVKADVPGGLAYNPFRMDAGETIGLRFELPMDPSGRQRGGTFGNPNDPSTWQPFATGYDDGPAPGQPYPNTLLLTHAADEGVAAARLSLDYNANVVIPSAYVFPATATTVYELGEEAYQRYPRFETVGLPLVDPVTLDLTALAQGRITHTAASTIGRFTLLSQGTESNANPALGESGNELLVRPQGGGGYLLARAAIVPMDVRIEAAIYAQEGSFFVIPAPWFNPNSNDTRDAYETNVAALRAGGLSDADARQAANQRRFEEFAVDNATPFYGEPLDVRVQVVGAVAENMPPAISQQAEWLKKWGWLPPRIGSAVDAGGVPIPLPNSHRTLDNLTTTVQPNLQISYDPALGTGRNVGLGGFVSADDIPRLVMRRDEYGRALPPLPRLPVSPALAYFGDRK